MIFALTLGMALLQGDHIFVNSKPHDIRGMLNDGTGAYWVHGAPSDEAHLSPQKFGKPAAPAEFFYHTDAYVFEGVSKNQAALRFRVFSQNPKRNLEMGKSVAL